MGYETASSPVIPTREALATLGATPTVEQLLGAGYEQALRSDLLTLFADGAIQHILCGSSEQRQRRHVVGGYHHGPSGQHLKDTCEIWPSANHDPANGDDRVPYVTPVMICGQVKQILRRRAEDRQTVLAPAFNTMFPRALSAVEVLELVRTAFYGRDRTTEIMQGSSIAVSHGIAPETPNSEAMTIRIIWNLHNEQIISTAPKLTLAQEERARQIHDISRLAPVVGSIATTKGPGRYRARGDAYGYRYFSHTD